MEADKGNQFQKTILATQTNNLAGKNVDGPSDECTQSDGRAHTGIVGFISFVEGVRQLYLLVGGENRLEVGRRELHLLVKL